MGIYRPTRNIEASLIDYITSELVGNWNDVNVEKSFARVFELSLPTICVRANDTVHNTTEVGSLATWRQPLILIDLFCKNDGQRLDLKDFLVEKLKLGCPYYNYTITNGIVADKTQDGRISVKKITDTPIDFDVDKDKLEEHDRYRHLLTLNITIGKVEI